MNLFKSFYSIDKRAVYIHIYNYITFLRRKHKNVSVSRVKLGPRTDEYTLRVRIKGTRVQSFGLESSYLKYNLYITLSQEMSC